MKRQTINVAQAINLFEEQGKRYKLETDKVLRTVFFKLARTIMEISGAYKYNLVEDEVLECNAGLFTMCIDWTNITITNNLTNQTCDIMTYTLVGKVMDCYFVS